MHDCASGDLLGPEAARRTQSIDKLPDELREMPGAFFIVECDVVEFAVYFDSTEPFGDRGGGLTLQDGSDALCKVGRSRTALIQPLADQGDHLKDGHRLYKNLVCLQKD